MKIVPLESSKTPLPQEIKRLQALAHFDQSLLKKKYVVGVDEVGRGPLAGPVVACACMLPLDVLVEGVGDSKKISPMKRAKIASLLKSLDEVHFTFAEVNSQKIDEINIRQASLLAMKLTLQEIQATEALVDAEHLDLPGVKTIGVTYGDRLSYAIGAASILAKEYRDAIMNDLDKKYPQYGFKDHKGYGTVKHREALKKYGPCEAHRFSFAPLKYDYNRIVV